MPSEGERRVLRHTIEVPVLIPDADAGLRVHNADLGRVIRQLRGERDLTIEGLALDAGMHPTYLSGIERGRRNPTWNKLADLAEALEVPVSTIILDAEEHCAEEAIRIAAADAYRAMRLDVCSSQIKSS
jgi:transcriptional regulator with XRE-family HTH domain